MAVSRGCVSGVHAHARMATAVDLLPAAERQELLARSALLLGAAARGGSAGTLERRFPFSLRSGARGHSGRAADVAAPAVRGAGLTPRLGPDVPH